MALVPADVHLRNFPANYQVTIEATPTLEMPNGVIVSLDEIRKSMIFVNVLEEYGPSHNVLPIPSERVDNNMIANVFNYLLILKQNPLPEKKDTSNALRVPSQPWEINFFNELSKGSIKHLFNFILTSNEFDIKDALDASTRYMADILIKGKTPDQLRETFMIKNESVLAQ